MKKVRNWILKAVLLSLWNIPAIGYVFLMTMIVAGGFSLYGMYFDASFPWAVKILQVGWKVYVAFVIITMFVMTTFSYLHCCVGMQKFTSHIAHYGKKHFENILIAILWPVAWFNVHQNLTGWGLSGPDVVIQSLEYWFITVRKGVRFDTFNLKTGKHTSTRVTPDTVQETMTNSIKDFTE